MAGLVPLAEILKAMPTPMKLKVGDTAPIPAVRHVVGGIITPLGAPQPSRIVDIPQSESPVPLKIIYPPHPPASLHLLPIFLYFHGGGFVAGSVPGHEQACWHFAAASGSFAVVSVDYRLAPEHKFPAAPEDSYASLLWIHQHAARLGLDGTKIIVGGDSAGGNLAAVAALLARDRNGPKISGQVLIYPVTKMEILEVEPRKSVNDQERILLPETMTWFEDHYLPSKEDRLNPLASPLLIKDMRGLPPALVLLAERDVLREEGEVYAKRLSDAGVAVKLKVYPGTVHGFVTFPCLEAAEAWKDVGQGLNALLPHSSTPRL